MSRANFEDTAVEGRAMMFRFLAAIACGSLLGCGAGETAGGPIGPSLEEQHIPAQGSRIPPSNPQLGTLDPQAVATTDPQSVPPGGAPAFDIAPGEEGCKDFCKGYDGECAAEICEGLCQGLRVAGAVCGGALLRVIECGVQVDGNCGEGSQQCLEGAANSIQSACATEIAQARANGVDVSVEANDER